MLSRRTLLPANPRDGHAVSSWVDMVTEFLEYARGVTVSLVHEWGDRRARWMLQLRRIDCSLMRRHAEMMQFEKNRLSLRCVSCGRETPGWVLDRKTPIVRLSAERRRPQGAHMSERKIA